MRKKVVFILIFILTLLPAAVCAAEEETVDAPDPPEISAKAAILVETDTGEVLYSKNPDQRAYPASITKIVTALLAVENGNLDKKIKVSDRAVGVEGSSIYLEHGEVIPLRDLVYGLMLRSGNDAAIAISEAIGGSTDRFVIMMNKRIRELGACDTNFVNPNGLHDPQHYTTARDMALIAAAAMKNPEFKKVAAAKSWVCDRGEGKYNYFYNKNKVVYQYSGGNGIKIGYTKAAGRTLVASSERNGMELICVVMNAPDWFNDTYKLMDYAYSQYEMSLIMAAQQPVKAVRVLGGSRNHVLIGSREDILCPLKKGADSKVSIVYALPQWEKAPISRWQEAGYLKIFVNGKYLFSRPLQYLEDVE